MNEEQVNVIVEFWKRTTGRAAPKKISLKMLNGYAGGFHLGEIEIHPIWADDETVFHELAHLEQWQDGRLTYDFKPIVSAYPREVLQDPYHCYYTPAESRFEGRPAKELPYKEQPVEIDARKVAKERVSRFRFEMAHLTNSDVVLS